MLESKEKIYRAEIICGEPTGDQFKMRHLKDGVLVVGSNGLISEVTDAGKYLREHPEAETHLIDYRGKILHPGFIDLHVHFPQTRIMGAHGATLIDWLNKYTFPEEAKFSDPDYASVVSKEFYDQLLRNGTTTVMGFSSSHQLATDVLFAGAQARGLRLIAGMVAMDRHCPDELMTQPDVHVEQVRELVAKWHGRDGRLFYAVTPRFAPSCSPKFLKVLQQFLNEPSSKDLFIQTHISENEDEITWVKELFPKSNSYTDVYDQFDLLGPRTILGHGIYLNDEERKRICESEASLAHCPTSNFFLASGLFSIKSALESGIKVGLATDVGGGTSFSMWKTMAMSYQIQKNLKQSISPSQLFLHATSYSAALLSLPQKTGCLAPGFAADFVVAEPALVPGLAETLSQRDGLDERLSTLMFLADDRINNYVFVNGKSVWSSTEAGNN